MSPGLVALGPGIFSVRGVTTMRLMLVKEHNRLKSPKGQTISAYGTLSLAIAQAVEATTAAPPTHHTMSVPDFG